MSSEFGVIREYFFAIRTDLCFVFVGLSVFPELSRVIEYLSTLIGKTNEGPLPLLVVLPVLEFIDLLESVRNYVYD